MTRNRIMKALLLFIFSILIACSSSGGSGEISSDDPPDNPSSVSYIISGSISGDIRQGVNIALSGAANANTSTDADGVYSISGLPSGTYTLTPIKAGYTFNQASRNIVIADADSAGNNFNSTAIPYTISGTITGTVRAGIAITVTGTTEAGDAFGPAQTITSDDGGFLVTNVPNGSYTVSAERPGYSFSPANHSVALSAENSTGRDFSASIAASLAFSAKGGAGNTGSGGSGGQFWAESFGSVRVLKTGTLEAEFIEPSIVPTFGPIPHIIMGDTVVHLDSDTADGGLYAKSGDPHLYRGNGDDDIDNDPAITGLTINAGATLVLAGQYPGYGTVHLENDLVIYGTITSDLSASSGIYIEANLIDIESTGTILASAESEESSGGEIRLGDGTGMTNLIINRGTIEAKGFGSASGGFVYCQARDLIVNYGTIDVSGGDNGGNGGVLEAYVEFGDFYSSGTVRMNGGNGEVGGDTAFDNACRIVAAYSGNNMDRNGDITIRGTWEARGGDGANGNGGAGGYMRFQTNSMGTVKVNASMSVEGGVGTGEGSWGGSGGGIDFVSELDPDGSGGYDNPVPGAILIAGSYNLDGGYGDQDGGAGGALYVYSGMNASDVGADIEFIGFPVILLNGGEGGLNGGSASYAFGLSTYSNSELYPAKFIISEADVQARGGNATLEGALGGLGGLVALQTGEPGDAASIINNSGNIDVSGGDGDTGGSAESFNDAIYMQAQHIENSGDLTANGGNGTTAEGGNGGNIYLTSEDGDRPTINTGTLSVLGGSGTTSGIDGTITIDGGGGPI